MNISLIGGDGRGDEICYISFSLAREYFGKQAFIQQNQNCVSFKQCTWLPHLNQLSSDENDMLLIGSLSLSGVLLLLLVLQTIGVACFVRKNRSRENVVKEDVNPLYGADNAEDAAEENNRRVSNSENYDYMGV